MPNQKLLIIDDSEDIQELVRVWLARESLDFFSCLDGNRAQAARGRVVRVKTDRGIAARLPTGGMRRCRLPCPN